MLVFMLMSFEILPIINIMLPIPEVGRFFLLSPIKYLVDL